MRRVFVILTALVAAATPPASAQPAGRPNILFILTDDQRGTRSARWATPRLRRPTWTAWCTRASISQRLLHGLDGRGGLLAQPDDDRHGTVAVAHPPGRKPTCPAGTPILPQVFNEAGYVTFHCGKAGNACTFSNSQFATNLATKGTTTRWTPSGTPTR